MVRPATQEDLPFLRVMLYEAAYWRPDTARPPLEDALADHRVARYLLEWGRPGDRALVAEDARGEPVGAAWYRLFPRSAPGYGFVDAEIPEISVAVVPACRARGVGTSLLRALIAAARADDFSALSLSVEQDNPARRLYEQLGFTPLGAIGGSETMVLWLDARKAPRGEA